MGAGISEGMQYAKQLYLYGDGKDRPVKNTRKLSELAGVSERAIRDHLAKWRQISTELSLNNPNSPYSLTLSEQTLRQHKEEIDFLGKQLEKLRERIKLFKDTDHPTYHVTLASYERTLTKWEKSSGLLAHYNTAESAMKEKAKAHERAMAKQAPVETVKRVIDKSKFDV